MTTMEVTLYISGQTPRSKSSIKNIRSLLDSAIPGQYQLDVVDVLEHPEAAEEKRILATPTLVKETPLPSKRIIGDFSDHEKICNTLEIKNLQE